MSHTRPVFAQELYLMNYIFFGLWIVLVLVESQEQMWAHIDLLADFFKADLFFPYRIREHGWRRSTPDTQQWVHVCTLI